MHRIALLALALSAAPAFGQDFKVPAGFTVEEYAGNDLATDIINLSLDPKGRVVVTGRGYIRILVEDPKTGKATSAIEFTKEPKSGAHGLLWEGNTLLFVGDDGLRKITDQDGDDKADGPSEVIRKMKTGNDHGAHHLRRGPDGWLYLLGGDSAGFDESFAELPTSPVKRPIGGCVVRFHPKSGKSEIVAHGFRNSYGFDFDHLGRLFVFDSDNERCIGMPWYEPTRLYLILEGAYYGWLGPQFSPRLWRIQPYSPDTIAPIATFGRGSPTFVTVVGNKAGTTEMLLGDWTFGRIYSASMEGDALGKCKDSGTFLDSSAGNGFAPTAAVQNPKTGDVFVSTGGRGTRGAVYRIRGFAPPPPTLPGGRPPLATEASKLASANVVEFAKGNDLRRLRSLERAARRDPDVAPVLDDDAVKAILEANFDNPQRDIAFAAARAGSENLKLSFRRNDKLRDRRNGLLAGILAGDAFDPAKAIPLFESDNDELVIDGLCLLQRRLEMPAEPGDRWEGYAGNVSADDRKVLAPAIVRALDLRTGVMTDVHRELARTFALIAPDEPATRLVDWLKSAESAPDTFHLLACLAHAAPKIGDGETAAVAEVLLNLDRSYGKQKIPRESNWPTRFGELVNLLVKRDPKLAETILVHPDFGAPEHAAVASAQQFPRAKALPIFVKRLQADPKYVIDSKVLSLLADFAAGDLGQLLRPYWGQAGLDEALLPFLAKEPIASDRAKFVGGLKSLQPKTVEVCLGALNRLKLPADDDEIMNLFTAWDNAGPKQVVLVSGLVERLKAMTGASLAERPEWNAWLAKNRPAVAARFALVDGVDRGEWTKKLDAVDWSSGDALRGKEAFVKMSCAACHSGTQTIGPDLAGVTGRFSRDDLFTAIVQPNKEVADRYRVKQVVTTGGKVHNGLVVYTAFDGVMLRTGPAETVRILGNEIESQATVARSLMPAGLLDRATPAELADLYAYLRSLKGP